MKLVDFGEACELAPGTSEPVDYYFEEEEVEQKGSSGHEHVEVANRRGSTAKLSEVKGTPAFMAPELFKVNDCT